MRIEGGGRCDDLRFRDPEPGREDGIRSCRPPPSRVCGMKRNTAAAMESSMAAAVLSKGERSGVSA